MSHDQERPSQTVSGVIVAYEETESGRSAVRYAASLGRALEVPTFVKVQSGTVQQHNLLPAREQDLCAALNAERNRVERRVMRLADVLISTEGLVMVQSTSRPLAAHAFSTTQIVVSAGLARERCVASIIDPKFDPVVGAWEKGPIVVPFGVSESGKVAARAAIPIAKQLRRPVLFYHTSWRNGDVSSDDPHDHLSVMQRACGDFLGSLAQDSGVASEIVYALADAVHGGIIDAAMRAGATMIVMVRSPMVGKGSYVDQVLDASPLPVCVVRSQPAGETASAPAGGVS